VGGKRPFISINFCLSAALVVISFIVVFWDVYQIGSQATKLCNEKAGLHVYRTAEAESFLGAAGIRGWADYGFKFTERESDKDKIRYFYENGKPTYKKVDEFISQYELVMSRIHIFPRIEVIKVEMKDRRTDEVLGESIEYSIDGGWADMLFYNSTGFSYSPWICSGQFARGQIYLSDVVKATLKPKNK
jgi:hypothetical protein